MRARAEVHGLHWLASRVSGIRAQNSTRAPLAKIAALESGPRLCTSGRPTPALDWTPKFDMEATTTYLPKTDAEILAITRPDDNLLWLYALTSLLGLIAAPIVFVPLYFKYHTLRYKLDEEGVSASWGILFRREVHLTYKRIQDIHVKRNFVERWLGIGTIEVQTASGSASSELSLEGMRDHEALRDFLYRRMRGHELAKAGAPSSGPDTTGVARAIPNGDAEVVALLRGIQSEIEATRRALETRL